MPEEGPQKYIITGASGLVGTPLVASLEADGHQVIRAVRRPVKDEARELYWDPNGTGEIEGDKFEGAHAVIHLAGENIAGKRWNDAFKKKLLDSRVKGTTLIAETVAKLNQKPKVFACASAIGYYGERGVEQLSEEAVAAETFLGEICVQWEACCQPARDAGVRVANMRIGVVLSPKGGALAKMLLPFKLGGGGVLGSGEQYMSWIDLADLVKAIRFVVDTPSLEGPVNMVAPEPVTNREFTKKLGWVLSRPTILPMPGLAARLAFGEMAEALLLASTRVVPKRLEEAGFHFGYPDLESSLRHQLSQ
ncbi:MAG: TIGR01777 family oxidoreductase [Planctomycetota bacterium]